MSQRRVTGSPARPGREKHAPLAVGSRGCRVGARCSNTSASLISSGWFEWLRCGGWLWWCSHTAVTCCWEFCAFSVSERNLTLTLKRRFIDSTRQSPTLQPLYKILLWRSFVESSNSCKAKKEFHCTGLTINALNLNFTLVWKIIFILPPCQRLETLWFLVVCSYFRTSDTHLQNTLMNLFLHLVEMFTWSQGYTGYILMVEGQGHGGLMFLALTHGILSLPLGDFFKFWQVVTWTQNKVIRFPWSKVTVTSYETGKTMYVDWACPVWQRHTTTGGLIQCPIKEHAFKRGQKSCIMGNAGQ